MLLLTATALDGCYLAHAGLADGAGEDGGLHAPDAEMSRVDGGADNDAGRSSVDADVTFPDVGLPDAGFEPGTVPFDYYAWCMRIGAAMCDPHVRCCGNPDRRIETVEDCLSATQSPCLRDANRAAEMAGSLVWNADEAEAILRTLTENGPTCAPLPRWKLESFFVGTIPEGGDCTPDTPGMIGHPWASYACAGDLRCMITGSPSDFRGTCTTRGPLGAPCEWGSVDCLEDQFCENVGDITAASYGVCSALRPDGSACRGDTNCVSGWCEGSVCGPAPPIDTWCYVSAGS